LSVFDIDLQTELFNLLSILIILVEMKKLLLSIISSEKRISIALLLLRLVFGIFIVVHGFEKLFYLDKMCVDFPDPLHVSSPISLALAIFAELFCGLFFIVGLYTRFVLIPLVSCMLIATFVVNFDEPVMEHELAPLFLTTFIVTLISGPGNISLDKLYE
jgi:putative oxidoreductase